VVHPGHLSGQAAQDLLGVREGGHVAARKGPLGNPGRHVPQRVAQLSLAVLVLELRAAREISEEVVRRRKSAAPRSTRGSPWPPSPRCPWRPRQPHPSSIRRIILRLTRIGVHLVVCHL